MFRLKLATMISDCLFIKKCRLSSEYHIVICEGVYRMRYTQTATLHKFATRAISDNIKKKFPNPTFSVIGRANDIVMADIPKHKNNIVEPAEPAICGRDDDK